MKQERRLYPRITQQLPLEVAANGYDFDTYTQNLSCVGTYCHIDKYVPPFTKVMVKLNLPGAPAATASKRIGNVECKGVIVRTEDADSGGYNIAIFFNGITEPVHEKLSHYVQQRMPHYSSPT